MNTRLSAALLILLLTVAAAPGQTPIGTAFAYQGQLKQAGSPVNNSVNMAFSLWDAATAGAQQGLTLTFDGVGGNPASVVVSDGLFTVGLDFGVSPYAANQARWLEITVGGHLLTPRQPLTPTPFALNTRGINVNTSGNVGIGAAAPGNKLEVTAASNGDGIRLTGSTSPLRSPGYHLYDSTTQRGTLGLAEGAAIFSTDALAGDIVLRANTGRLLLQNGAGMSAMAITGNNVGIGTTSPENILHVFKASAGSITGNTNAPLIVENNTNTYIQILAPDANEQGILFGKPTGGSAAGGIVYDSAQTTDGLQFRTNGNITRMVITAAGDVGIGTVTPGATLDVNGDIRIATTTRYVHVPVAAFAIVNGGAFAGSGAGWSLDGNNVLAGLQAIAPVFIPDGAVVTEMHAVADDGDPAAANNLRLRLQRKDQSGGANGPATLADVSTIGSGINQVLSDTSIVNGTIDNQNFSYYLYVTTVPGVFSYSLWNARITYTVTSPLP